MPALSENRNPAATIILFQYTSTRIKNIFFAFNAPRTMRSNKQPICNIQQIVNTSSQTIKSGAYMCERKQNCRVDIDRNIYTIRKNYL